jgi:hypothetical protein
MQFQDGSISIQPGDPEVGYAIKAIGFSGIQNPIKIIDQLLTGISTIPGILNGSDSILLGMGKVAASLDTAYTTLGIASGTAASTQLTAFQRAIIIDGGVTGKTIILPNVATAGVIPGCEYIFSVGSGLVTTNTIAVPSGNYMNDTLNGTFSIGGLLSARVRVGFYVHNSRWYANP